MHSGVDEFGQDFCLQLNKLIDQEVKNFTVVFKGIFSYEIGETFKSFFENRYGQE